MNKQELIKHIEKVKGDKPHYREQYHLGRWQTIESMLELIDQLDEPEITEEQAWEVIERANHQHIAPAYVWIYKKAIQKGLTPTDITGLEENPTISKKETVEVPQFVADYIEKMKNGAYPTIGVSFKTPECMPTNVMNWLGHYDDMDDVDTDAAKKIKKNTARLGLTDTPSNHQKRYK